MRGTCDLRVAAGRARGGLRPALPAPWALPRSPGFRAGPGARGGSPGGGEGARGVQRFCSWFAPRATCGGCLKRRTTVACVRDTCFLWSERTACPSATPAAPEAGDPLPGGHAQGTAGAEAGPAWMPSAEGAPGPPSVRLWGWGARGARGAGGSPALATALDAPATPAERR